MPRIQDFTLDRDPARGNAFRDPSLVGLNVLAAFDFTTLFGRPGGGAGVVTPVTNVTMQNYVDGKAPAKAINDLGYAQKSLVLDPADTLSLGNDFLLPTNCTDFIVYWWMKATVIGGEGFNNRIIAIRQNATDLFRVSGTYASGALTTTQVVAGSTSGVTTITSDAFKAALVSGSLHLFAVHVQSDGANWRARHFLDGDLDVERQFNARPAIPAKLSTDYGFLGKGNNAFGITGSAQRAGLIDMTGYTARSADSIIKQQYVDHATRLTLATA